MANNKIVYQENHGHHDDSINNYQYTKGLGKANWLCRVQQPDPNYKQLLKGLADLNDAVIMSFYLSQSQKTSLNEILMATNGLIKSLAIQFTNNDIPKNIYSKIQILVDNVSNLVKDSGLRHDEDITPHMGGQIDQPSSSIHNNYPSFTHAQRIQNRFQNQELQNHQHNIVRDLYSGAPFCDDNEYQIPNQNYGQNLHQNYLQNRVGIFQDRVSNLSPSISTRSLGGNNEEADVSRESRRLEIDKENRLAAHRFSGIALNSSSNTHLGKFGVSASTSDHKRADEEGFDEEASEFDDEESNSSIITRRDEIIQTNEKMLKDNNDKSVKNIANEPHERDKSLPTSAMNKALNSSYKTPSGQFTSRLSPNLEYNLSRKNTFQSHLVNSRNHFDKRNTNNDSSVNHRPITRPRPQSMYANIQSRTPDMSNDVLSNGKRNTYLPSVKSRRSSAIYERHGHM